MKLSKQTIEELGIIMKNKFNVEMSASDLEKFAYALIGFFSLLLKAEFKDKNKAEFGNSSARRIDNSIQNKEDERKEK